MTLKVYLKICALCAACFFVPMMLPAPQGSLYFVYQSTWSFVLAIVLLDLSDKTMAKCIAAIEFALILVNFGAFLNYEFHQYFSPIDALYNDYVDIKITLNGAELLILIFGVPKSGIFNRFTGKFSSGRYDFNLFSRNYNSRLQGDKAQAEKNK